jgi:predicted RNA binding protein YcfA (HicA-like mRNA interferase family)
VSQRPSSKASRVYRALLPIAWSPKAQKGSSHITLQKAGYADFVWASHDRVEIGPKMLTRLARRTAGDGGGFVMPTGSTVHVAQEEGAEIPPNSLDESSRP